MCVRACVHMRVHVCMCLQVGMVQLQTTVRCGALSQDSPGPAQRASGVCLQGPRGAGSVGAAPPPAVAQASGGSPGAGGSGQVSEDRLS